MKKFELLLCAAIACVAISCGGPQKAKVAETETEATEVVAETCDSTKVCTETAEACCAEEKAE